MARRPRSDVNDHDPAGPSGLDPRGPEPAGFEAPVPSRSQRKREALALQRLGVALTRLTQTQLQSVALPEELLEAVLEARRLRSRAALARQQQYIGRLMRHIDPAPIERALQALNAKLTG